MTTISIIGSGNMATAIGILVVEPNGATVGAALNGTVIPASLLVPHLSIPIAEGIAAFGA